MRILIIRTDRIGDLVLSIPVSRALRKSYPSSFIGFLALKNPAEILKEDRDINLLHLLKDDFSNFKSILKEIKSQKYTHAITLVSRGKSSWIPFLARIPFRIGPYSKPLSFLKYNKGIFQRRSRSIKNEAEYNLELLNKIGIDYKKNKIEDIKPFLEPKSVSFPLKTLPDEFGVIHPGMGGSALNLSKNSYLEIAKELSQKIPIYLTFGPGDASLYSFFLKSYNEDFLIKDISLDELVCFYSKARFFIGPSTGPMHLAAASGAKVFAIFSPVKVQSERRWGPWGSDAEIISPDVLCTGKYSCMKNCRFKNCLLNLDPEIIIKKVLFFLNKNKEDV